jgi:ribosomal protein S18 acetylase RimI-like enzyme
MEFRRVLDRTGGCEVGRINCAAYTMPGELGSCLGAEKLWKQGTFGYLGFVDDEPVCTSTVLPIAETLYVVLVATLPDYEKRGFGEAVMRHSLEQGSEETGIQRTALHASDAGYPLYKAMGYRDIAKFTLVLRQE